MPSFFTSKKIYLKMKEIWVKLEMRPLITSIVTVQLSCWCVCICTAFLLVMSASQTFTCITCRVAFKDAEAQRSHYKTDWHRYNLKRKVAELLPVSADNFQDRVLAHQEVAVESDSRRTCEPCKKHFTSQNSYESHLRSRKHRETVSRLEKCSEVVSEVVKEEEEKQKDSDEANDKAEEIMSEEGSEVEPEPLELTECLFCPHESSTMELSLSHMSKVHGFFIPELEYMVDLKGLIGYLCEKVGVYYMCLYCNMRGKAFHSVESVQQHMMAKCHCKIFFEGEDALEYAEYYDYTKSYPASGEKEVEGEEDGELDEGQSPHVAVPNLDLDVTDDLELVLPSGAKVGHRALKVYYKQRTPTLEQRKSTLISRLMAQYRALGWKEPGKVSLSRRDASWAKKMQSARSMKLSVKANKLQHHFRPQVVF